MRRVWGILGKILRREGAETKATKMCTPVWIGDLGSIGVNVENGGRDTHRISDTNHGKAGILDGVWSTTKAEEVQ